MVDEARRKEVLKWFKVSIDELEKKSLESKKPLPVNKESLPEPKFVTFEGLGDLLDNISSLTPHSSVYINHLNRDELRSLVRAHSVDIICKSLTVYNCPLANTGLPDCFKNCNPVIYSDGKACISLAYLSKSNKL